MKALSLTQPWATLVVLGFKTIETRSWPTKFRGCIAVHASKGFPGRAKNLVSENRYFRNVLEGTEYELRPSRFPLGAIVGTVEITDCVPTSNTDAIPSDMRAEYHFGDYSEGRYMYFLRNAVALAEPIPCRGALSFWEVPSDVLGREWR